jgi:segregation and condensation protein B
VNQARTKKITPTPKKRAGQRAATHDANHSERTEAQTGVQTEAQMEAQTEAQAALEAALMDGFLEASQHPQASNAEGVLLETLSAALLAAGRPVKPKELTNLLGVPVEAVFRLLETLRRRFQEANLGFDLEAVAGGYRLIVASAVVPRLEPMLAPPPLPGLSAAALETLAIIAWKQPVTRGEIELMRGASAGSTLETLQERELIKVVGRKEVVGKPMLFGTTERFLLEFGLSSLTDLPPVDEDDLGGFLRG